MNSQVHECIQVEMNILNDNKYFIVLVISFLKAKYMKVNIKV